MSLSLLGAKLVHLGGNLLKRRGLFRNAFSDLRKWNRL